MTRKMPLTRVGQSEWTFPTTAAPKLSDRCSGSTVDLRFFDFPTATVSLLAGITIGWSDRHRRGQAAAGGDVAERVRPRRA